MGTDTTSPTCNSIGAALDLQFPCGYCKLGVAVRVCCGCGAGTPTGGTAQFRSCKIPSAYWYNYNLHCHNTRLAIPDSFDRLHRSLIMQYCCGYRKLGVTLRVCCGYGAGTPTGGTTQFRCCSVLSCIETTTPTCTTTALNLHFQFLWSSTWVLLNAAPSVATSSWEYLLRYYEGTLELLWQELHCACSSCKVPSLVLQLTVAQRHTVLYEI